MESIFSQKSTLFDLFGHIPILEYEKKRKVLIISPVAATCNMQFELSITKWTIKNACAIILNAKRLEKKNAASFVKLKKMC